MDPTAQPMLIAGDRNYTEDDDEVSTDGEKPTEKDDKRVVTQNVVSVEPTVDLKSTILGYKT